MAELDLSLSDALMDSVPQAGPEGLVERDFVAQLECEAFDDQVGETVGKTDYIPLLDIDGTRAGSKVTPGGQISASCPEPQGEVRTNLAEHQVFAATDFLSGSMAGVPDQWSSQPNNPPQMMAGGLIGDSSGFSQPAMGVNVDMGMAPLSADRPPSIAEHQKPPPKDMSAGALGDGWPDKACIPTDLPFTTSVSTVISQHASHLAASPEDPPDCGWPHREALAMEEEKESNEGNDHQQQQQKKKKRRPRDEVHDRGQPEAQAENTLPSEGHHRVSPRKDRDRMEGGWEREEPGRSGGRGKRGKSRKKLPEEWGFTAEPFLPSSAPQLPEGVLDQLVPLIAHPHAQPLENPYSSMGSMGLIPGSEDFYPDEGLFSPSLTQDLHSLMAPTSPSPVMGCDLLSTAPVSMPTSRGDFSPKGTFPMAPRPGDPFTTGCQYLLMDTETANLGNDKEAFTPTFPLDSPVHESGVKVIFDHDTSMQDVHMKDAMSFSTTHHPDRGLSPLEKPSELTATAPPFSPSDSSWLINDSHFNNNNNSFEFSDITPGHPLPVGLAIDTPSPVPLRSPKTMPEFYPRGGKEAKSPSQKIPKKSHSSSSSSSSSTKSPTSPGSGLNPAAKPFFPSFADPTEPLTVVVAPMSEVKSEKMDKLEKEEMMDNFEKLDQYEIFDKLDRVEKKDTTAKTEASVKVDYTDPLDKGQKMYKIDKAEKTEKLEPTDKAEKTDEEEKPEMMEKMDEKTDKVEKMDKVQKTDKEEKTEKDEKTDKVEKMDKVEKPKKTEQKEQSIEKVEEKQETSVNSNTFDKMETQSDKEKTDHVGKVTVTAEKETDRAEKPTDKVEEEKKKPEKTDKVEEEKKPDKTDKVEEEKKKLEKTDKVEEEKKKLEKTDKVEEEKSEPEKTDKLEEKKVEEEEEEEKKPEKTDKVEEEKVEEKKPDKTDKVEEEKKPDKTDKVEEEKKPDKTEKVEEEKKPDKTDLVEEEEKKKKPEKTDEQVEAEKSEKKELKSPERKTDKIAETADKAKKPASKPSTNGSGAAPSQDLPSPDKKTKPFAGATKPSAAKPRPSSAASDSAAAPKRPTPSSTSAALRKKTPMPKTPTPTSGHKRPSSAGSRPASAVTTSITVLREVKPKTTERRPLVPKAAAASTAPTATPKNGTATTATSKPATATHTTTSAPATRRPLASKTDSKLGEDKKSTTADSTRPRTSTTRSSIASTTNATPRVRPTTTKPATAPSTSTVPEKKPPGPRIPRPTSTTTSGSASASGTTSRPSTAPAPDIRNVRSKIGSTDNMKYQPAGGKVSGRSDTLAQGSSSKETSQAKVQILNKKVDLSKVTSKCGSKVNIKHKPGGGDVKIESQKVNFKDKAKSKVGSMDNLCHEPGSGSFTAEENQEIAEGNEVPPSDTPAPVSAAVPGQASSPSQENGVKEAAPCQGLHDPQGLDSRIPETN